jgi:hypothetical protein
MGGEFLSVRLMPPHSPPPSKIGPCVTPRHAARPTCYGGINLGVRCASAVPKASRKNTLPPDCGAAAAAYHRSVRKVRAGRPSLLNTLAQLMFSDHAYRTAAGLGTCRLDTTTVSPSIDASAQ